jgi:hypothetical protein
VVPGAYTGPVSGTGPGASPDGRRARRIPAWLTYTLLRLLFFVVPLVVVYLLGGNIVIAALAAAIIGVCLSVILLHRQRAEVAAELDAWRASRGGSRRGPTDEDVEDAASDGQSASAAASPKP